MKRLTIYAFYDPDGLVDAYVIDCVTAVAAHSERVLFVSNGEVDRDSFRPISDLPNVDLIERINEGLDIWGYKHGLDLVGWSQLEHYDEVVMMNSTIVGPLYPLSEMFDAMDATDVDFWGITAHAGEDYDPWNLLPTGRIERHIQSYFMAVRRRMLQSAAFRSYWDTLVPLGSYTDAVARHEAIFTYRFTELGFRWTTYVDGTDLESLSPYPLVFMPEQVLIGKRCPFFKRKALFLAMQDLVATHATSTTTMLDCLHRLGYDLQRVLPNVIRTNHQFDLRIALNAFELLVLRPKENAGEVPDVQVVAWVTDVADCLALELHRSTLERCAEFVIVTPQEAGSQMARRLGQFKARAILGTTFADFVREVGRASSTEDHVLLFGAHGGHHPEIGAYVRSETGLRALAGNDATLASAAAHLADSTLAGALTSPLAAHTIAAETASWHSVWARTERLLMGIGIQVPMHPEKPAWGPPSGVVLAGPGMLAADWNLAADILDRLDESSARELFASVIPFIVQSHGRLLAFALPEPLTGPTIFAAQIQTRQMTDQRTLQTRIATRATREYRQLRHQIRYRLRSRAKPAAR